MKKNEFTFLSTDNKTDIHVVEWIPDGEVKGCLQIAHGMIEYIDRYDDFACYLADRGYYVAGNDHLGHGKSVSSEDKLGYFGHPNGNDFVIWDMRILRKIIEKMYPDVPHFMLGHSMGSFLLSQYITEYGDGLSGAIIMGTGYQSPATIRGAKALCNVIAKAKGWDHRSEMINNMALAGYNKPFEPARTRADWLTKDELITDAYVADPLCSFMFTVNGYHEMFKGIDKAHKKSNIDKIPKDLPLLIVSGAEDPVGNMGKGVKKVYDMYKKAGLINVKMKLYEGDRHEILNETDRQEVYKDILEFMEAKIDATK